MKKIDFLVELVRACFQDGYEDEDVLACMIVLHTHCLKIQDKYVLEDAGETGIISPLTRRHASEIVAQALSGLTHCDDPNYWNMKYDSMTPFEVAADIPDSWKALADTTRTKMKRTFLSDLWPD